MTRTDDCSTSVWGCTATLGNFTDIIFDATSKTWSYSTPDLWKETVFAKFPYQKLIDHIVKTHTRFSVQRTEGQAVASVRAFIQREIKVNEVSKKENFISFLSLR